jgi:hypothetical protein
MSGKVIEFKMEIFGKVFYLRNQGRRLDGKIHHVNLMNFIIGDPTLFILELSQMDEKCRVTPKGQGISKDEMVLRLGHGPYLWALPNQHKRALS